MAEGNTNAAVVTELPFTVANNNETTISSPSTLNATSTDDNLKVYLDYHESEIEQNKKIYKLARAIIWTGFGVMMLGVVTCFFGLTTPAILTASAGVVTEIVSGTILTVLSQSTKSKKEYYKQLSLDRECDKYITLVQDMNIGDDKKMEILNKLIGNYCKRRK